MPTDLDTTLRGLSATDHPGLAGIEATILADLRSRREARAGRRTVAVTGLGAMMFGMVLAAPNGGSTSAPAPVDAGSPLAPSTLLATDR